MSLIIKASLLSMFEMQVNKALKADHIVLEKLQELEGRVLKIRMNGYFGGTEDVFIYIRANGLHLSVVSAEVNEGWFEGSFIALRKILLERNTPIKNIKDIRHGDDPALLKALDDLRRCFDYDWENLLYDNFGDLAGCVISSSLNSIFTMWSSVKTRCSENAVEYLQEELRCLPSSIEFELFAEDVAQLEQKVDQIVKVRGLSE